MGPERAVREAPRLLALAALLAGTQAGMIALAPALVEQDRPGASPILAFVALALLGGAAWFAAIGPLERLAPGRAVLGAVLALGAAMRLGWLCTPLVLDTDALRYLWDGALAAHGLWPWGPPPAAELPPGLGEAGAALHARLPFAELRSIYPGTAQFAFLLGHWVAPWDLLGLRAVMLGAELATLALLAVLLRRAGLPPMRIALWWLCPLLPVVLTNAAHVDALLPPLLLGVLLATLRGQGWLAGGLLGLAAGVKVWPLLLAPLVARWLPVRAWTGAALAGAAAGGVTLLPLAATLAAPDAGLRAYASAWVVNNAPLSWALALLGWEAGQVLRPLLALGAGGVALAVARQAPGAPEALIRGALVVSAAVFYLSPAQYPWYAVWFLPFAALLGCRALLLPAVLLPLYYLFFALLETPWQRAVFAQGIAAVHVLGVVAMLFLPRLRKGCARMSAPGGLAVAIIIPTRNEAQALPRVLAAIPPWIAEVIVVDNASTDGTPEIATRHGARLLTEPRRGYGRACLAGIAALSPQVDTVLFMDGDASDRPEDLGALLAPIAAGEADLVIGARRLGVEPGALTPQQRFGNALACRLIRLIWGVRYTDLGPFRAIRRDALARLAMRDETWGWTVEMQVRAARIGLRVRELPVGYRRRIGTSKISGTLSGTIRAGWKILWVIGAEALDGLRGSRPGGGAERPGP